MNKELCSIDGCSRANFLRTYCSRHYHSWRYYGDPLRVTQIREAIKAKKCSIKDCGSKFFAKERCVRHYNKYQLEKNNLRGRWYSMKQRCYNPDNAGYVNYGGRGIKVCERWLGEEGLSNFIKDMGEPPTPAHSIDRRDVDGDYSLENCRWVTRTVQNLNTRLRKDNKSGYRGVGWLPNNRKWQASIRVKTKDHYLGIFTYSIDAARAYNKASLMYFGKDGYINFIEEDSASWNLH